MILGIEASNIRSGGGIAHLKEVLAAFDPGRHGFETIVVWSGADILDQLPRAEWLQKRSHPYLDGNVVSRLLWQRFIAPGVIDRAGLDVLFVPGALHHLRFRPLVVMSHNMLPFEPRERDRYGFSYVSLRLRLLGNKQSKAFLDADGVLFLTRYARDTITRRLRGALRSSAIVPHGVGPSFAREPGEQRPMSAYSMEQPFRILYVSIIDIYKHQRNLSRAVVRLRAKSMPVTLDLVGPDYPPERRLLDRLLLDLDPERKAVRIAGALPPERLAEVYRAADLFAFPSSCENLPNILLEAMASGLPIACSRMGPMPEILEDGGEYLDPENVDSIVETLERLISDPAARHRAAARAYALSKKYTWESCADATFSYLASFGSGSRAR